VGVKKKDEVGTMNGRRQAFKLIIER